MGAYLHLTNLSYATLHKHIYSLWEDLGFLVLDARKARKTSEQIRLYILRINLCANRHMNTCIHALGILSLFLSLSWKTVGDPGEYFKHEGSRPDP